MILEINGIECDLTETVALTFKGPSLAEVRSGSAYSNTFTLPYSRANSKACGRVDQPVAPVSASPLPCRLLEGGIDLLAGSGTAFVRGAGAEGYSVDVKGGAYDFFNLARTTRLDDLDWSPYDMVLDASGMTPATSVVYTAKLTVPIIAYGRQSSSTIYDYIDVSGNVLSWPGLRLKSIVDTIAADFGYTVVQEPTSLVWDRYFIPFHKEQPLQGKRYFADQTKSNPGTTDAWSGSRAGVSGNQVEYYRVDPGSGIFTNYRDIMTVVATITSLAGSITLSAGTASTFSLSYEIYKDTVIPGISPASALASVTVRNSSGTVSTSTRSLNYQGEQPGGTGFYHYLVLRVVPTGPFVDYSWSLTWALSLISFSPRGLANRKSYLFSAEIVLPDGWTCAEMLAEILSFTGCFISVDEFKKEVSIIEATHINTVKGVALDWSKKYIGQGDMAVTLAEWGATNTLNHSTTDSAPAGLGDGSFSVANAEGLRQQYGSRFCASAAGSVVGLTAALVQHWVPTSSPSIFDERAAGGVPILTLRLSRSSSLTSLRFESTSITVTGSTVLVGQFENRENDPATYPPATLAYAAANAYAPIADWAAQGRRFTARFLLSLADIYALSAMQTVGAYQFGGIFYPVSVPLLNGTFLIESISQWVAEDIPCEVTLTKIG